MWNAGRHWSERSTARAVTRAAALASAVLAVAAAPTFAPMPHPAPTVRARTVDQAACEECHADIAEEWRGSLHHASFADADFQRGLGVEPAPFCVGCHAPESDSRLGVACVTCHVPSGDAVLAAQPRVSAASAAPAGSAARRPSAPPPHPVLRSADFAADAACASCHEFDFPDAKSRQRPLAMQRTVSEHAGRGDACATCHMTKRNGHADHRFLASRDEASVKSAATFTAHRDGAGNAEITITAGNVGHAFPTGDLFRRLRVSVGTSNRFLARHYANRQERPGIVVRSEIGDDRVLAGPRVVRMPIGPEKTRVRVVYERAEGVSDTETSHATVAGAIVLYDVEL